MQWNFEQITTLQYRNRSLSKQVDDFKSGEKYRKMDEDHKKLLRFHNKEMKRMEYELSKSHSETVTVRRLSATLLQTYFQLFMQNKRSPMIKQSDVFSIRLFYHGISCVIIFDCNQ